MRRSRRNQSLLVAVTAACAALLGAGASAAEPSFDAAEQGAEPGPVPIIAPDEPVDGEALGVATSIEDPTGSALRHFFTTLQRTARGDGQTRLLVFGASHMAGDIFTKVWRHHLQGLYGDAGIGFVVPAKPWRDYYNRDANISYSKKWDSYWVSRSRSRDDGVYGLAGVAFESDSKRAWSKVETAHKSDFGRTVSRVEVFYWKQPKGGDFDIVVDGKRKKRVKTKAAEAGPGYEVVHLADEGHEIELKVRGNGLVTLFGMALDRDVPGVVMDHLGINGARAATQLEWDPRILAEHLARRDPDLVVLAYGTNAIGDTDDPIADYEKRLDLVVTRVRAVVPQASCMLIGPSDRPVKVDLEDEEGNDYLGFLPRPRQADVIEVQRRVAHRWGCAYWDWATAMGGSLSMVNWTHSEPRMGARDYVHLTRRGYERVGDLFLDALQQNFERGRVSTPPAFVPAAPVIRTP